MVQFYYIEDDFLVLRESMGFIKLVCTEFDTVYYIRPLRSPSAQYRQHSFVIHISVELYIEEEGFPKNTI